MVFITCATAALTAALSANAITIQPPLTPTTVSLQKDSVCTATKVTGTITDTAHKGRAGVWLQDGILPPLSPKVKTDDNGAFTMMVDQKHKNIYLFGDSVSSTNAKKIGMYVKRQLQVKDCVAAPITIVLKK